MSFDLVGNTITIEQGSTFSLSLNWTNSADETIDLTSYSARMKGRVRQRVDDRDLQSDRCERDHPRRDRSERHHHDPAATTTATYEAPLLGVYDLELVSDSGFVTKILKGRLRIDREVTR
jgi:hypothetical protein